MISCFVLFFLLIFDWKSCFLYHNNDMSPNISVWLSHGPKGTVVAVCVCFLVRLTHGPKGTVVAMCVFLCAAHPWA